MIGEVFTPSTAVKSRRTFGLNHNTESLLKGLYQSCTSWRCNFSPFFCKTAQSSVRLHRDQAWTALFKSSLKHYVGLRSELWLGRSATFTSSTLNHFWVPLSVCFGSTSCWKINLLPSHRSLAHWIRLSSKISRYFAAFISPSTFSSLPGPAAWCCRHHAPQCGDGVFAVSLCQISSSCDGQNTTPWSRQTKEPSSRNSRLKWVPTLNKSSQRSPYCWT